VCRSSSSEAARIRDVDLHDRPGGVEHNQLAGGRAGHRRVEPAGGDDMELLEGLVLSTPARSRHSTSSSARATGCLAVSDRSWA
jgi:hypothetical protein